MTKYKIAGKIFTMKKCFAQEIMVEERLKELGFDMRTWVADNLGKKISEEQIAELFIRLMKSLLDLKDLKGVASILITKLNLFYRLPLVGEFLFDKFHKFNRKQIELNSNYLDYAQTAEIEKVLYDFFAGMLLSIVGFSANSNASKPANGQLTPNLAT